MYDYGMVDELATSYRVATQPDGSTEIRIRVESRYRDLWLVKLNELRASDLDIASFAELPTVPVRIDWTPTRLGGRTKPFRGDRYSTIADSEELQERFEGESWSLVVLFAQPATGVASEFGLAHWFSKEGPHDLLRPGARFRMMEGERVSAVVEVLDGADVSGGAE
jgi:hypothetical protein